MQKQIQNKTEQKAPPRTTSGVLLSPLSCTSSACSSSYSNRNRSSLDKELKDEQQQQISMLTALLNENKGKFSSNSYSWHDGDLIFIPSGVRRFSLTGNCNTLPFHCCSPCLGIKLHLCPSRCLHFHCSEAVDYFCPCRPLTPTFPQGTTLLSLRILMFLGVGPFCGIKGDLGHKKKQLVSQWLSSFSLCGWLCPYASGQQ